MNPSTDAVASKESFIQPLGAAEFIGCGACRRAGGWLGVSATVAA